MTLTIIKDIIARADHPFENLEERPLSLFARDHIPQGQRITSTLRYLECYLQITDQTLTYQDVASTASDEILATFCGALSSPKFATLTKGTISTIIRKLTAVVNCVRSQHDAPPFSTFGSDTTANPLFIKYRSAFESLHLNEEKVWYWSGWACLNGAGKTVNLPLVNVYYSYGRKFTQLLYNICETYLAGRRLPNIQFVSLFSSYLSIYPNEFDEADFSNKDGSTLFFSALWRHLYLSSVEKNLHHETAIASWRYQIIPFIKTQLIPNGLFAKPDCLADPAPTDSRGQNKNLKERSVGIVKANLLTEIPLHISDDEAFRHLKRRIIFCHSAAIEWCNRVVQRVQTANKRLALLARDGKPILTGSRLHDEPNAWLASNDNPDQLKNLAATLEIYGYDELRRVLKNCNVSHGPIAESLGLPTTDALIPICIKLISLDPKITPSFLTSVAIFDKNGKCRGIDSGDTIEYLHGHKDRRGPSKSEIRIPLNEESKKIVQLLVDITSPLRASLKKTNDPRWRKLLLTSRQFVGPPCEFGCKAKTDDGRVKNLVNELTTTHDLSHWKPEELEHFAKAILCPSKMRTTSGVVHFLETGSLHSMAKVLGHANYDPKLLATYLPTSILHYFRDRWVRVFQTGVIVQAMKSSKLLLEATNFTNDHELASFLENHTLPDINEETLPILPDPTRPGNTKVLISISLPVARILLTLKERREEVELSENLMHWAEFCEHLLDHLHSDKDNSFEALEVFKLAKELGPMSDIGISSNG